MRTTIDLPDDVLRKAKIEAVERGCTLRELVIDALKRELDALARPRKRMDRAPVRLADDAPLRTLSAAQVKRLDSDAVQASDEGKARAVRR